MAFLGANARKELVWRSRCGEDVYLVGMSKRASLLCLWTSLPDFPLLT